MYSNQKLALAPVFLSVSIALGAGYAFGYSSVYSTLEQTHNSLLEQRDHLQRMQSSYNDQIGRLQAQLNVVNGYLSDNDRALRDIEEAMRNASR
jgi:hypothetical protein